MLKIVSANLGGKTLTLETGRLAKQASGAVLVSFGDTRVLVTAVADKTQNEGQDFFPLTCDYIEKYYASGKIPGGYLKREARPGEYATLVSRFIDRPIRPLFPSNFLCETQVVATVLSYDPDYPAEQAAMIGASAALSISDAPFHGPLGACFVARVNGKFIASPSKEERAKSDLDILVAATEKAVLMVEGFCNNVADDDVLEAILFGHAAVQDCIKAQKELMASVGKAKRVIEEPKVDNKLKDELKKFSSAKMESAFAITDKLKRYGSLDELKEQIKKTFLPNFKSTNSSHVTSTYSDDDSKLGKTVEGLFEDLKYEYARSVVTTKNTRIDGRSFTKVRNITCETSVLPRTHGSSVFTRGETQVLATVTLGSGDDEQYVDSLDGLHKDTFMLHYNFPPYSVGEVGRLGSPGRREVGHGNLAKRGLMAILPEKTAFPYTIRIVSEVLESNGSSSMGTVCSGCMALMDAGVPIKEPVAGVAMGLIQENDKFFVLTDILGDEDHLGDMDFKVVGTKSGITSIQMDIKVEGISKDVLKKALDQAKEGRLHILGEMMKQISVPRSDVSKYAPRIKSIVVDKAYIKDIIGSGGKNIKAIQEKTGSKIEIKEDGTVNVFCNNEEMVNKAIEIIKGIVGDIEPGTVFDATVKKIMDFGAFVEYLPGQEGLVHVSEIAEERVERVEDFLQEGQQCKVAYLGTDKQGRVKLSIRAVNN